MTNEQKKEFTDIMLQFATAMYDKWCSSNFIDGTDWRDVMFREAATLTEKFLEYRDKNL